VLNARLFAAMAPKKADPIELQTNRLTPPQRWLSLAELAVGSAIVFGHDHEGFNSNPAKGYGSREASDSCFDNCHTHVVKSNPTLVPCRTF
jgi:hypothetical protein